MIASPTAVPIAGRRTVRPSTNASRSTPHVGRRALQAVARTSGGRFFEASDADGLNRVYEQLRSQLGTRKEEREITDLFSAGAIAFLLAGATLSTLWFRRVP